MDKPLDLDLDNLESILISPIAWEIPESRLEL